MRRPWTPGQMVHSVSATDLDWERVRERAEAAGMSMSRYGTLAHGSSGN